MPEFIKGSKSRVYMVTMPPINPLERSAKKAPTDPLETPGEPLKIKVPMLPPASHVIC